MHMGDLTIVVPGADAVESRVGPQDGTGSVEVLEEVGGDLEIVLEVRKEGMDRTSRMMTCSYCSVRNIWFRNQPKWRASL